VNRVLLAVCVMWLAACREVSAEPEAPLRVMTLNIASGAGDRFRTLEARGQQAALLADVHVAALQEVDVDVERSGKLNTAIAVAGTGLADCASGPLSADGVLRCSSDAGSVFFGRSFQGDDMFAADDEGVPSGIIDGDLSLNPGSTDRRSAALFGNALIVRGARVDSARVVALPIVAGGTNFEVYETIAEAPVDELGAHNLAIRSTRGIEPRSVLIVRLSRGTSVLVSHFEAGSQAALRLAQLSAAVAIARGERRAGRRVLLLGDFNMSTDEAAETLLEQGFFRAAGTGLDQMWADSSLIATEVSERPTENASDHPFAPSATISASPAP
jgi:endonuclease/exonuclease/phosphatase family metal-dependent hydrolase